jgi:hypothetical protein
VTATVAITALAILAGLPGPASADPRLDVSLAPATLSFPGASEVTYRVRIETGAAPERFSIELSPRPLPDGGAALVPIGEPAFEGPGSILGGSIGVAIPACAPSQNRFHGYERRINTVDVDVPPAATTALVLRYESGAFTPWPGASVGVRVRIARRLTDGSRGTLRSAGWTVPSPAPRLELHRSGVRLRLRTSPHSDSTAGAGRPTTIERGRPIDIRGATWPRLARVRIRLAAREPGAAHLRTIAVVRTDRHGRFRHRGWRPQRRGHYELWAFYRRQRVGTVSDHRCPRGFELVASKP